jgi:LAO/AO transport system kinase
MTPKIPNIEELTNGVLNGNITVLAQAITLIESTSDINKSIANQLINNILPSSGKSIRIGITGSPGVGKSTFIDAFGSFFIKMGKKVAVLAVDPSSKISGGSILGDKTRMEKLSGNSSAFIRPSPSSLELGGVAKKTSEAILLCEAAGFDVILIETIGVGQSETAVKEICDFMLFLVIAGAGDELQGIKRGIMEMLDMVIINKTDLFEEVIIDNLKSEFNYALHLFPEKESSFKVPVLTYSALNETGFELIYAQLIDFLELTKKNNFFENNRNNQKITWMTRNLEGLIINDFYQDKKLNFKISELKDKVTMNKISPIDASQKLFDYYKQLK